MGAYRFSMAPNISVPRSKFHMPFNHITAFNHGKLVPVDCFEILPGDEFKLDMSAIIRMSTPIAPLFSNIKGHVHAFFIPMRLVWEHTQEFYGENKTSSGYQTYNYQIPTMSIGDDGSLPVVGSVSHYLGKPLIGSLAVGSSVKDISCLKERCYYLVWNEYYRAQQLQNPVLLNLGDNSIGTYTNGSDDNPNSTSTAIDFSTKCMNVCKEFDYLTACTLSPQYGSSVSLPLGTSAPIIGDSSMHLVGSNGIKLGSNNGQTPGAFSTKVLGTNSSGQVGGYGTSAPSGTAVSVSSTNMIADLSNATAASINSIRYAFACQKWLERANFGSRFFEMLNLHYGITSPDARLQRPEYLGGQH